MNVLIFANRGHGTTAIKAVQSLGHAVTIVSKPPKRRNWKCRMGDMLGGFRDPFEKFPHPSTLGPSIASRQLNDLPGMGLKPDLILCCSFHRLIPQAVLDLAPVAVNIHAGLLPERAGGTPNRWAIYCGDKETGVTAHLMTDQFDAGPIVWQERTPIRDGEVWGDLELRLTPLIEHAARYVLTTHPVEWQRRAHVPNKQPSFKGDTEGPWSEMEIDRACRATWPKMCGLGLCKGTRLSGRLCRP